MTAGTPPGEVVRPVAVRLAGLAQTGLEFSHDHYDVERYLLARSLSAELLAALDGASADDLVVDLAREVGYATPKLDVRGVVVDDAERVLLMQERSDGLWSVPGGWADPLDTPTEAVVREIREETGYDTSVVRLIACWDRDTQGHRPALPVAVYKLFFLCRATGGHRSPDATETLDVGWFALDQLPPLSTSRVLERQLHRALAHHRDPGLPVDLD